MIDINENKHNFLNILFDNSDLIGINKYCNICGYRFEEFIPVSDTIKRKGKCPVCESLERHRHFYIYLSSVYPFLKGKKVLNLVHERIIENLFENTGCLYYLSDNEIDIENKKININSMKFKNDYLDLIIAQHIFEHEKDDIKAMKEFYRVMTPYGKAFIFSHFLEKFNENPSIIDPEERKKEFFYKDHLRGYSKDKFVERLKIAGFSHIEVSTPEILGNLGNEMSINNTIVVVTK